MEREPSHVSQMPMKVPEGIVLEPVRRRDGVRDAISVIFKWKWMIVGALLAVVVPVAMSSLYTTAKYRATARTIVKQDRVYLSITPGEDTRNINFPVSRATINSELKILKSREVMENAVKKLAPLLLASNSPDGIGEAVLRLQDRLDINPVPDSNVIEISYIGPDPDHAVQIVNEVAEAYQARHAEIVRHQGAYQFFDRQAATYLERLREAERRLKLFEKQVGVVDFGKELVDARRLVDRLTNELQTTAVQIGEERTRVDFLKEEIDKQPVRIAMAEETIPNRAVEQLNTRLLQLEQEKGSLLQLYTEKDRRVTGKQEEIDTVRRSLAAERAYVEGRKQSGLNPIRTELEQEFVTGQARLSSLFAKERTLNRQLDAARKRFIRLEQGSSKYEELRKTLEISQHNHALFHKRSEEAQIAEAMDREKLINVAILERAALPLRPIKQKRYLTVALAALVGMTLGFGMAFGVEFFNSSVRTERLLEEQLDLPVLATIEKFPV